MNVVRLLLLILFGMGRLGFAQEFNYQQQLFGEPSTLSLWTPAIDANTGDKQLR